MIGAHPGDEAPIELYEGRYGVYVKHGGINATVPNDLKPEELTVEQAVSLLAERAAKGGGKKPKAVRAKKTPPAAANDAGEQPEGRKDRQEEKEGRTQAQGKGRRSAAHRDRWLRAAFRPATSCWPSSRRAPRRWASARSRVPTG